MPRTFQSTPPRRPPAVTLACVCTLAGALGACGRGEARGAAATRAGGRESAAAPATARPGVAQAADTLEFYSASDLARIAAGLGSSTGKTLSDHPGYKYIQGRRTADGVPEVHDAWLDLGVVQAGRAVLVTGGHVVGGRMDSPGEHRGGVIEGGTARPVAPGDLYLIPAGVPHQYRVAAGDTLRYLTVKLPAR